MSLFLGKDNSNSSILHLTNGSTELSLMKSGVLSNTVFHSEMPYITWEEHPCNAVTVRSVNFIEISPAVGSYLWNNRAIYFVTIGDTIIQGCQVISNFPESFYGSKFGAWYSYDNYLGGFYEPKGYPDSSFVLFLPPGGADLSDIHIYSININNGVYSSIPKTGNEILVNRNEITIKGVNLLNLQYLNNSKINNTDLYYNLGTAQIQLINSIIPISNIMSIISNSVESSIYRNSDAIFTSLSRGSINLLGSSSMAGLGNVSNSTRNTTITLPTSCIGSICYLDFTSYDVPGIGSGYKLNIPALIKVGSGFSFMVYRDKYYNDNITKASITISSPINSNTIIVSCYADAQRSIGSVSVKYVYFN